MKASLLIAILSVAGAAQTQTVRVVPVHLDGNDGNAKSIQFLCTQEYDHNHCLQDTATLQHALAPYTLDQLGSWSFLLVPSDGWKDLVRALGGDPVSPAFSIVDQRITVIERGLFLPSAIRGEELLLTYGVIGPALLDWAVTHELGHSICHDADERHADDYGRGLRDRKPVRCLGMPGNKKQRGSR